MSLKDLVLDIYKKKPIEVIDVLVVLEHGIQPELDGLLPEQVNLVSITELKRIKKFIELVKPVLKIMHQQMSI